MEFHAGLFAIQSQRGQLSTIGWNCKQVVPMCGLERPFVTCLKLWWRSLSCTFGFEVGFEPEAVSFRTGLKPRSNPSTVWISRDRNFETQSRRRRNPHRFDRRHGRLLRAHAHQRRPEISSSVRQDVDQLLAREVQATVEERSRTWFGNDRWSAWRSWMRTQVPTYLERKRTLELTLPLDVCVVVQDIGARDPFEGELVTGFGNKPLGNADTEHQIRAPDAIANLVGLGTKKCVPCDASTPILSEKDVERLRNQVPGWRLGKSSEGKLSLFQDWKMKDFSSALTCFQRIGEVADSEGHHPDLHLTEYNQVRVELYTHAAGGLTENDFILAFKLNELDFSDLVPKRKMRLWA